MKTELWFLAALTGVGAGGCMLEVGEPGAENVDGVYEDEVAVTSAELSGIETSNDIAANRFLGINGSGAFFFDLGGEHCMPANQLVADPLWEGFDPIMRDACGWSFNRVAYDNFNAAYFSDFSDYDIVRYHGGFTKLADTNGATRGLFADTTHVYWADNDGLRKISRDGGAITTISFDPSLTLLALRGSTLYFSDAMLNNRHELRRVSTAGGNSALIANYTSTTGFKDFAVDGSAMYWVDNTQATNRIRRLSHALGAAITTVISHSGNTYGLPTPTANGLHFVQWTTEGFGSIDIRRWLNGTFTTEYTTLVDVVGMHANSEQLRWVEKWPNTFRVKYADL